jgi:hypothetical protein
MAFFQFPIERFAKSDVHPCAIVGNKAKAPWLIERRDDAFQQDRWVRTGRSQVKLPGGRKVGDDPDEFISPNLSAKRHEQSPEENRNVQQASS